MHTHFIFSISQANLLRHYVYIKGNMKSFVTQFSNKDANFKLDVGIIHCELLFIGKVT